MPPGQAGGLLVTLPLFSRWRVTLPGGIPSETTSFLRSRVLMLRQFDMHQPQRVSLHFLGRAKEKNIILFSEQKGYIAYPKIEARCAMGNLAGAEAELFGNLVVHHVRFPVLGNWAAVCSRTGQWQSGSWG